MNEFFTIWAKALDSACQLIGNMLRELFRLS